MTTAPSEGVSGRWLRRDHALSQLPLAVLEKRTIKYPYC